VPGESVTGEQSRDLRNKFCRKSAARRGEVSIAPRHFDGKNPACAAPMRCMHACRKCRCEEEHDSLFVENFADGDMNIVRSGPALIILYQFQQHAPNRGCTNTYFVSSSTGFDLS